MSTVASSLAAPQSAAQAVTDPPLPDAVVHLQRSMKVLEAAASALAGRKSAKSKTKENAKLLVTAGNRLTSAIISACAHRPGDLHILAKVHVSVARESIDEWTTIVNERGRARLLQASAMEALVEMLEIENGIAGLVLDPARCLGLSQAKPSLCETCTVPKLSTSLAVYEGFKVVVQGLANMTDGAPWPWKAIPQTVLQFTSMVERALDQPQKVRDLADRIARRVSLLLNISQNKGSSNPELDAYVELFLADVQRIIMRLRIIEKTHPAKAFPLTDHIDAVIAGEAEKMQTALQELQVRFAVHTAYGVDATKDMVTEIHARVVSSSSQQAVHISTRARLPARPSCFKGRMNQLSALVKLVCESLNVRIAIMGPGDNLETLWFSNNGAAQKDTERFLQRLADVQSLTLIVTSRGSVTPSGIEWTNDQSAELQAISLNAARETFEQIAGRPSLATELEALDKLLTGVDCMPLAVTLLAQLARQKNSPSQLLQRWHHSKTASSISLDLLSAMTGGTESGQLLSICAHLPDGLRLLVFAQLVSHFSNIHAARDLLVTFALVSVGSNDELRMLSPVRHFVLKHLPMTTGHLAALREIYFAIAAFGPVDHV
ncbi:hypothetical protein BKA62DRAFT_772066 [Auriculariales sp. MPI-PUGE-AT-0066]|nr:hypothetical protein BKA62DRAFT_772066 [Auriculariales sp. MPI-PUGE-AT-0066]